jgi:hypothetical protein
MKGVINDTQITAKRQAKLNRYLHAYDAGKDLEPPPPRGIEIGYLATDLRDKLQTFLRHERGRPGVVKALAIYMGDITMNELIEALSEIREAANNEVDGGDNGR